MKNIFSFLLIAILFIGCSNEQDETYNNEKSDNKEVKLKTRANGDGKLIFPALSLHINHASNYSTDEIIFDIPRPTEEHITKMNQKYGNLPRYDNLDEHCYIQYQMSVSNGWSDWYYYNPDSILCKTPYPIETETGTHYQAPLREAALKASMFPSADFRYRIKIFNSEIETEWIENYSFESWIGNRKGFSQGNGSNPGATGTSFKIELQMLITVELNTYGVTQDGTYRVNFGDMFEDIKYYAGTIRSHRVFFTYTTTVYAERDRPTYLEIPYNGGTYRKVFIINDYCTPPNDFIRFDENIILRVQLDKYL